MKSVRTAFLQKAILHTTVPLIQEGSVALKQYNDEKSLGFDDDDIKHYTELFINYK